MRIVSTLRAAAIALALTPAAIGLATFTPANAQLEETVWRDQGRIAAHTQVVPEQLRQIATGPSATASDAGQPVVTSPHRSDPLVNGAGVRIDPRSGVTQSGYSLGGF